MPGGTTRVWQELPADWQLSLQIVPLPELIVAADAVSRRVAQTLPSGMEWLHTVTAGFDGHVHPVEQNYGDMSDIFHVHSGTTLSVHLLTVTSKSTRAVIILASITTTCTSGLPFSTLQTSLA